jgi:hypothetical protein
VWAIPVCRLPVFKVLVFTAVVLAAGPSCSAGDGGGSDARPAPTATVAAPTPPAPAPLPESYREHHSERYGDPAAWLCHPRRAPGGPCDADLTATVVHADGSTEVEPHTPAADPPTDCFYVYPTVSGDPGYTSDLEPQEGQEIRALLNQAARLSSVCRLYAPMYRQMTLQALSARMNGSADEAALEHAADVAYGDVLDAFKQYMANENNGRGVILIGHSQGAGWLGRLAAEEVDDQPGLRSRLVAAYILGGRVAVPPGADVGGSLEHLPLCRRADQTGCVVVYGSYPATQPPGEDAVYGTVEQAGMVAGCTNPAALGGGSGRLRSYFTTTENVANLTGGKPVTTPWVALDGFLSAECQVRNGHSVLEVSWGGDPTDTRVERVRGNLPVNWGMHQADVNLAMGNLIELARSQSAAYHP